MSTCITLARLADHKKLSLAFLQGLGWRDGADGVEIPYKSGDGIVLRVRHRTALAAKDGSHWGPGKETYPYGRQRLELAEKHGRLLLVEGETDCVTLLFHGFGALGIPGCQCAKSLAWEDVRGVGEIYIHCEPDAGGKKFRPGVLTRLAELGYTGRVYLLQLPAEFKCKDLSDLHCQDPAAFPSQLNELVAKAPLLTLTPPATQPPSSSPPYEGGAGGVATPGTKRPRRRREVLTLDQVTEQRVEWLWGKRIPLHMLTLIEGDPGMGKSTLTLTLAACMTRGAALPFDLNQVSGPQDVLILSSEDDVANTIKPRLRVLRADMSKVHFFSGLRDEKGALTLPSFPSDLDELENEILASGASLVIIDPLSAFLDETYSPNRERDMRRLFYLLQQVCTRTRCTMLVLRHLNKVAGADPLQRGSGTMSIIAAVRSGLLVAPDPTLPESENTYIVAVNKKNLTGHVRSVRFQIVDDDGIGRIEFRELVDIHARELLGVMRPEQKPAASQEALKFLAEVLQPGPQRVKDLKVLAEEAGIPWRHVRRAQDEMPVNERRDGFAGGIIWELVQLDKDLLTRLEGKPSA